MIYTLPKPVRRLGCPRNGFGGNDMDDALIVCAVVVCGTLLIVLFGGEPDLMDTIIHLIRKE